MQQYKIDKYYILMFIKSDYAVAYVSLFMKVRNRFILLQFQKNGRDFDKLQKTLLPDELSATLNNMNTEQRLQYLESSFQEHLEMYRQVIERVCASD